MRVIQGYITKAFITDFMANLMNRPAFDIEERMSNDKFVFLLERHIKVSTAFSKEDLVKLKETNPALFQFLTNLYSQSQLSLDFKISSFLNDKKQLYRNSPYKFIFGDFTDNEIDKHEKKIGFPVLSTNNFQDKWGKLAQETELAINKGETGEDILEHWKDLDNLKMPIHSIVIADQYLFAHRANIESNVLKLLRRILPKNFITHPIDITILTMKIYKKNGQEETLEVIHKKIENYYSTEQR